MPAIQAGPALDATLSASTLTGNLHTQLCVVAAGRQEWATAAEHARLALALREETLTYYSETGLWAEVAALAHSGAIGEARALLASFDPPQQALPRAHLVYRRALAAIDLAEGRPELAIIHLEAARSRATALNLPGQEHTLLRELLPLYETKGASGQAEAARQELERLSRHLAHSVADEALRSRLLASVPPAKPE